MPDAFTTSFQPPLADADLSITGDERLPIFDPPSRDAVLTDLADPHHSLVSVAAKYGATLEALTLWMNRPRIADALASMQTAASAKARLTATIQLPRSVPVLLTVLAAYQYEENKIPVNESLRTLTIKTRHRGTALRAAYLLLRIASYTTPRTLPPAAAANRSPDPTPDSTPEPTHAGSRPRPDDVLDVSWRVNEQTQPVNQAPQPPGTHARLACACEHAPCTCRHPRSAAADIADAAEVDLKRQRAARSARLHREHQPREPQPHDHLTRDQFSRDQLTDDQLTHDQRPTDQPAKERPGGRQTSGP